MFGFGVRWGAFGETPLFTGSFVGDSPNNYTEKKEPMEVLMVR